MVKRTRSAKKKTAVAIRNKKKPKLLGQMKKAAKVKPEKEKKLLGNTETMISTGSTLLDLAISSGRKYGGGIPGGVFIEIAGPPSCGKTVLLCEIAGSIQRAGGDVRFDDPEARLNKSFASIFDLDTEDIGYDKPDTVTQVFKNIREWKPRGKAGINGSFTDSLAALSTDLEMDNEDGDKMGQRRAKEFSEGFRKNARIIANQNFIMVASNQLRSKKNRFNPDAVDSPGGWALDFYASCRIWATKVTPITKKVKINGVTVEKEIGATTTFFIKKSSIDKPHRKATLTIIYDYGIDDVRENLQFIKDHTQNTTYKVGGVGVGKSMTQAITHVEKHNKQEELRKEVIELWNFIESKFSSEDRVKKVRF